MISDLILAGLIIYCNMLKIEREVLINITNLNFQKLRFNKTILVD